MLRPLGLFGHGRNIRIPHSSCLPSASSPRLPFSRTTTTSIHLSNIPSLKLPQAPAYIDHCPTRLDPMPSDVAIPHPSSSRPRSSWPKPNPNPHLPPPPSNVSHPPPYRPVNQPLRNSTMTWAEHLAATRAGTARVGQEGPALPLPMRGQGWEVDGGAGKQSPREEFGGRPVRPMGDGGWGVGAGGSAAKGGRRGRPPLPSRDSRARYPPLSPAAAGQRQNRSPATAPKGGWLADATDDGGWGDVPEPPLHKSTKPTPAAEVDGADANPWDEHATVSDVEMRVSKWLAQTLKVASRNRVEVESMLPDPEPFWMETMPPIGPLDEVMEERDDGGWGV